MIVAMKRITLLCLERHKVETLNKLGALGLLQISQTRKVESDDIAILSRDVSDAEKVYYILMNAAEKAKKAKKGSSRSPDASDCASLSGEQIVKRSLELLDLQSSTEKELAALMRDEEKLTPWGDFQLSSLEELRRKGVYVYPCMSPKSQFDAKASAFPPDLTCTVISKDSAFVYYVLIAATEQDGAVLDLVTFPASSLAEIRSRIDAAKRTLNEIQQEFVCFSSHTEQVKQFFNAHTEKLEFSTARDGMERSGTIAYLYGYLPVPDLERFRAAAQENGWALLIEDPSADDDQVPTCIRKAKFLSIMDPLFDFIGVSPGYRENDVNVFFLIFFPIFFGLIVGDAGYGVLFILAALTGKFLLRKKEAARLPLNLFLMLSCFSLLWGCLNGSWFGLPKAQLPVWMRGWSFLTDPQNNPLAQRIVERLGLLKDGMSENQVKSVWAGLPNKFVQYLCFAIAALHLSSARLFRFCCDIKKSWRAFGHIGWGLLIIGNFFMAVNLIVFSGTFPVWAYGFYIIGVLLIVATISGEAALNLPFALIGSFVDVLSYIRLFAVGLAGVYIADNFNKMGGMLMHSLPDQLIVLGFIFLLIVALFGHVLNIALGFLSVLVHAIRLNTLEFSNHVEMQWGGTKFKPFRGTSNPEAETNR